MDRVIRGVFASKHPLPAKLKLLQAVTKKLVTTGPAVVDVLNIVADALLQQDHHPTPPPALLMGLSTMALGAVPGIASHEGVENIVLRLAGDPLPPAALVRVGTPLLTLVSVIIRQRKRLGASTERVRLLGIPCLRPFE